jgi:uncharacterized protein YlzI (FlbEa/FlbD family)
MTMEIYELIERDGDYTGIVYLNTAHIVAITEDKPEMEIHMSNGKTYQITDKDAVSLRTLLHASKAN